MRSEFYLQWRKSYQLMLALVFALLLLIASFPVRVNALSSGTLIALTNQQRAANGLAPLAYNGLLSSSAAAKAQHMLALNYWGHSGPDGSTAWTFIGASGYGYITAGENLAKDFGSDGGVMAVWMASPSHRANILNAAYTDIGIAVIPGTLLGSNTTLVVAHYGASRQVATPTPAPAPAPAPPPRPAATPAPRPVAQPATIQPQSTQPTEIQSNNAPAPAQATEVDSKPTANTDENDKQVLSGLHRILNEMMPGNFELAVLNGSEEGQEKVAKN